MEYIENIYEKIGGEETISKLVNAFYGNVAKHPDLIPIFPDDLTEVANRQFKFLTQFFGGPLLYSMEYGHPMLRARHIPFPITPKRAEAWLSCMHDAMDKIGLEGPIREHMFQRLTQVAYHMVNQPPEND
ncbi:globin [Ammoniphilus resinae]|uniref:Hemoglobin n=1 Tax=Ammoniphilus resinae TaxID=861532 RepID=A0ABS4GU13_9BACL|nr:globin [Ammoniphilus resinae]MBP1933754.1 hemoglobin [Ammoniphilus resinae]